MPPSSSPRVVPPQGIVAEIGWMDALPSVCEIQRVTLFLMQETRGVR